MRRSLLPDAFSDSTKLQSELLADITRAGQRIQEAQEPHERRNSLRALFAVVEGLTYSLKQEALALAPLLSVRLDTGETCLLKEESYEIENDGTVKTRRRNLRVAANFKFSVACYVKVTSLEYAIDMQDRGWEAFRKALSVRNRIVHPKTPGDLHIPDDELAEVRRAANWILNVFLKLNELTSQKLREYLTNRGSGDRC